MNLSFKSGGNGFPSIYQQAFSAESIFNIFKKSPALSATFDHCPFDLLLSYLYISADLDFLMLLFGNGILHGLQFSLQ